MKILFVASEANPFIKTGGLGDVLGALPKALQMAGHDIHIVLPKYRQISQQYGSQLSFNSSFSVSVGWRHQGAGVYYLALEGIHYYFIENNHYFDRDNVYGYFDDAERFAFFSKATVAFMVEHSLYPDVLHLNDWQTGMIAPIMKRMYSWHQHLKRVKIMYTIHNLQYQGVFDIAVYEQLFSFYGDDTTLHTMEAYGATNFMKSGCYFADFITTVSPTYAQEIQTTSYGERLDGVMRELNYKIEGIVNGIDTLSYNPATDANLVKPFDGKTVNKHKQANKKALQQLFNLPLKKDTPLIGVVGRLADQKGFDLIVAVMARIVDMGAQVVLLGTGEPHLEQQFIALMHQFPKNVSVNIAFDDSIARKIYAGSDFFLMPSRFEPCGIGQLLAMQYGTIPIVRATGGLKDTVQPYNFKTKKGKGFDFVMYESNDFFDAISRALALYENQKADFAALRETIINDDYSWTQSAQKYLKCYKKMQK
ncbi:MAG: glycogen synthase GlgA [Culicoidibacterales bacterium]